MRHGFQTVATIFSLWACSGALAQPQQAGTSAGVTGGIQVASAGAVAGAIGRQVRSGESIFIGDRIRSGAAAGMQIVLLDETVFTIGAESDITVDEFIYNPANGSGKLTASIGKGAFRFVTGKIAQGKPENMTVKTPVATMGIRGTIVYGLTTDTEAIIALGGPGPGNNAGERRGGLRLDMNDGSGGADLSRTGFFGRAVSGQGIQVQKMDAATFARLTGPLLAGQKSREQQQAGAAANQNNASSSAAAQAADAGTAQSQSGQSTAPGGVSSEDYSSMRVALQQSDSAQSFSSEDQARKGAIAIADGPTDYDQLRSLTSGSGNYSQTNIFIGNATGAGGSGSYNFSMTVDFATQSITGAYTSIFVTGGPNVVSGDNLFFGQTYTFNSGPTFIPLASSCGISSMCTGMAILVNANNRIADFASHSLIVTNGIHSSVGGGNTPPR